MPFDLEPDYQVYEYHCQCCGESYREAGSIKKHPDYQYCPGCKEAVKHEELVSK